jgi:mannose-6-phosphate isomerase-like protein (cupin superfamily)
MIHIDFKPILAVASAYVLAGALLDSVVFPEKEPGPEYYPTSGYSFDSNTEGFTQTVVKREKGLFWVELELKPHAPGPLEHVYTSFAEKFVVAEGTLSVLFNGQKRILHAGEALLVPPGIPHKPFNETDARVLVKAPLDPEYAMPECFSSRRRTGSSTSRHRTTGQRRRCCKCRSSGRSTMLGSLGFRFQRRRFCTS